MTHAIQVVPRLPPSVDGVGDYALNLALQLRKDCGIETHFVVGDDTWSGPGRLEEFTISKVADRSRDSLLRLLPRAGGSAVPILLHYVGYGYEKRGCPRWLVEGLRRWVGEDGGGVLLTMFHEVYARGPVWSSSFWLSPAQRKLAAALARISRASFTSRSAYAEIIRRMSRKPGASVSVLPVFSNVGEPELLPPPLAERRRRLVVFGGRGQRQRVFGKSLRALERVCRAMEIGEVFDIGQHVGHDVVRLGEATVTSTGRLAADEISRLLADAVAGFFHYPTDYLSKSTIFAAYCAHRMIPVVDAEVEKQADELKDGLHFWTASRGGDDWDLAQGQEVADRAYHWYQGHALPRQAQTFADFILQGGAITAPPSGI